MNLSSSQRNELAGIASLARRYAKGTVDGLFADIFEAECLAEGKPTFFSDYDEPKRRKLLARLCKAVAMREKQNSD